jgi:hypothetical protein
MGLSLPPFQVVHNLKPFEVRPSTAALTQHREKATAAALGLALLVRREWGWQSLPHYWGHEKVRVGSWLEVRIPQAI